MFSIRQCVDGGQSLIQTLPSVLDNVVYKRGLWRFFSHSWPPGGITWWNRDSPWRQAWDRVLPPDIFSFGEDVFGNQLVLLGDSDEVFLLDHETPRLESLYLPAVELLLTVLQSGLEWIDAYDGKALAIADGMMPIDRDNHLHWVTPLFLGGGVSPTNTALIERNYHLVGHAKLWLRIEKLGP